jgi:hypothetical protein
MKFFADPRPLHIPTDPRIGTGIYCDALLCTPLTLRVTQDRRGGVRLAKHKRLRIYCNSNGVPEKIWGRTNVDAAESATERPAGRARAARAVNSVKKEMTRSICGRGCGLKPLQCQIA